SDAENIASAHAINHSGTRVLIGRTRSLPLERGARTPVWRDTPAVTKRTIELARSRRTALADAMHGFLDARHSTDSGPEPMSQASARWFGTLLRGAHKGCTRAPARVHRYALVSCHATAPRARSRGPSLSARRCRRPDCTASRCTS